MTLTDWDQSVGKSLQFIEIGAEMAARHARMLPFKPPFETKAQGELAQARKVLECALAKIKAAEVIYERKAVEHA